MARSLWKGSSASRSVRLYQNIPFIQLTGLLTKNHSITYHRLLGLKSKIVLKKAFIQRFYNRQFPLSIHFLYKDIFIHNGKTFLKKRVSLPMINHKVGEFCMTRKIPLR